MTTEGLGDETVTRQQMCGEEEEEAEKKDSGGGEGHSSHGAACGRARCPSECLPRLTHVIVTSAARQTT